MKIASRGDRLTVKIESLAVGGRGVARHQGLVIFISAVAPLDEVEIELTSVKKAFAEARVVRLLQASDHRREPPCPYASPHGQCGGCSWQHVTYEEQLRQKHAIVLQALRRHSGFSIAEDRVAPVAPSPLEFRYRNRIQLHHGGGKLGYFKRGSHEIIDIDDCLIAEEAIAREIPKLKREWASRPPGRMELRIDQNERIALSSEGSINVLSNDEENTAAGPAFSQVNRAQNQALIEFVLTSVKGAQAELKSDQPMTLFDLFAGQGNFAFPLAREFGKSKVIAVEMNNEAVRLGRERARLEASAIEFHQGDVGRFLSGLSKSALENAVILLDPPRTGCDPEVMRQLAESSPARIVYVSCHPVTLARDLRYLHDRGFELLAVHPFDMFPQTDHVESVAVLRPLKTST